MFALRRADRVQIVCAGTDTQMPLRTDPVIVNGFRNEQELYQWARRDDNWAGMPDAMLRQMAKVAYNSYEKSYPSRQAVEAECATAVALANHLTRNMSDVDVANWFDQQNKKAAEDPNFKDITVVSHGDTRAENTVLEQSGNLLPVLMSDMDQPERMICFDRYGQSKLPNGQTVLQPVADAYIKVLVAKRDRGERERAQ